MVGADGPFPVQSCPAHGFFAGYLPDGCQALIAQCIYGYIILVAFDRGGTFLKSIRKDLPSYLLVSRHRPGCYEVQEAEFYDYLKREFGFVPGLIRVREFHLPQEMLAVCRLPELYRDFLTDANDPFFDDQLRQDLPDQIKRWRDEGRFVLQWGNDFWLNRNGEVTAS